MASSTKYYVTVADRKPFTYEKGYTLKNAKTFARIGSSGRKDGSESADRIVTRGPKGPVIRVYSGGERVWPVSLQQIEQLKGRNRLKPNEIPKSLTE
jgi:hypothetical protein